MLKYYETFEVKLDPIKFAGRTRGVDVDNSESQKASGCEFPLKSGWGFYEVDSWHCKEDYQEVRIYPDETCIKKWKYESDLSEGTYEGVQIMSGKCDQMRPNFEERDQMRPKDSISICGSTMYKIRIFLIFVT